MRKRLIKILAVLLFLSGCNNNQEQPKLYLFETADYCDFSDTCRVIYLKSHRQLLEKDELYLKNKPPSEIEKVYNAFGHVVSLDFKYPKIIIDTTDKTYDITIHMHSPADSILSISSAVKLENLGLTRYYMPEVCRVDELRSVFQFLDPLPMLLSYEVDNFGELYNYTIRLINYKDIDFKNGERVVLEYDTYKIPIPYQTFEL